MSNHLKNQTSPYLIQHAENPVDWYPWCEEAFERARKEDKPVFLSIGYSTCHWCHVMAHESFEDEEIAEILNKNFVSIKVDKEERPDIDSIYMSVCQAITGSGGWPTTIFMTAEQQPFFAGTYFPKTSVNGHTGFMELLEAVTEKWNSDRDALIESAEEIIAFLDSKASNAATFSDEKSLINQAMVQYERTFDEKYGGFGTAPKFPTPHNLLFLMRRYEKSGDKHALLMAEKTLTQMYRGGIFDHIGGGFSRYSTDQFFLVPHFEKMLYDNGLLIMAYSKAYQLTRKRMYRHAAEKTAEFIMREMTAPDGGFYSAQDADSDGEEGKFYLLEPEEIRQVLDEEGTKEFCRIFDITERGNFEGKNIPNLLKSGKEGAAYDRLTEPLIEFRKKRFSLHLDDKILTGWNGLMIAAMCSLYRVTGKKKYLTCAEKAQDFIEKNLMEGDTLYISWRDGKHNEKGLLDDYAFEIMALISLYEASLEKDWLEKAERLCKRAVEHFLDDLHGGFFMYGDENEQLILKPKETYDGAIFSGNSAMAYNMLMLWMITGDDEYSSLLKKQIEFMSMEASRYPSGHGMFLSVLSDYMDIPDKVTIVFSDEVADETRATIIEEVTQKLPLNTIIRTAAESDEYRLKDGKTTFYQCREKSCLPPVTDLDELKL